MAAITIRDSEGCAPDPFLLWDSLWFPNAGEADWALATVEESFNRGGLRARSAIASAVILALFTDARVPADHPLAYLADGDPRGWWGDGIDLRAERGEAQLGSLLWLLERAPLTVQGQPISLWAERMALDALLPLHKQGAVVRIETQAVADEGKSRLELTVQLYGRDGASVYDRKFDLLWQQSASP